MRHLRLLAASLLLLAGCNEPPSVSLNAPDDARLPLFTIMLGKQEAADRLIVRHVLDIGDGATGQAGSLRWSDLRLQTTQKHLRAALNEPAGAYSGLDVIADTEWPLYHLSRARIVEGDYVEFCRTPEAESHFIFTLSASPPNDARTRNDSEASQILVVFQEVQKCSAS